MDRKEKREELPDDILEQSEIHQVDMVGKTMYLSNSDMEVWKTLSNAQRQAIHKKQIYAIKNGHWIKVMNSVGSCTGIITKAEALKTGYIVEVKYPDGSIKLWTKHELAAYQKQSPNNQLIKTKK